MFQDSIDVTLIAANSARRTAYNMRTHRRNAQIAKAFATDTTRNNRNLKIQQSTQYTSLHSRDLLASRQDRSPQQAKGLPKQKVHDAPAPATTQRLASVLLRMRLHPNARLAQPIAPRPPPSSKMPPTSNLEPTLEPWSAASEQINGVVVHASSHHLFSSRTCASSSGVKSFTILNVLRISSAVLPWVKRRSVVGCKKATHTVQTTKMAVGR